MSATPSPFKASTINSASAASLRADRGGRRIVPIDTLAALTGQDGKASVIYIKSDDPANENAIRQEIGSTPGLQGYRVQSMGDIISMYYSFAFPRFRSRPQCGHRDCRHCGFPGHLPIHVYGGSRAHPRDRHSEGDGSLQLTVVGVVLRECGVLAVAGVLVGIAATYGVRALLSVRFPSFAFQLTAAWIVNGALIAFAGSLCGALYPAWMAARKDPIDALAYE